jgi:hypothetical protein
MIFWKEFDENIEIHGKKTFIKTDYEEGRLQPTATPAGHPTLPLSPWYFEEKNWDKIIEIDKKKVLEKSGLD